MPCSLMRSMARASFVRSGKRNTFNALTRPFNRNITGMQGSALSLNLI